jgi:hypothetical protein
MNYSRWFHQFQETFFNIFIGVSWFLLILTSTGIFNGYPEVFKKVAFYVQIYICLFLIWRFNPLRHFIFNMPITFTSLDRKIAFSAGLIILSTTVIQEYVFSSLKQT